MKNALLLTALIFIGPAFTFGQEEGQKPVVMKPVYFDVSPPLRDMVQPSDALIDHSWKEGIVKNKLNTFSNESGDNSVIAVDAVVQSTVGDQVTDTTIQNFDGVGANGSYPPDTDGDVGPNHYMQVVNCRFAVYDKNGNKLMGPTNNSQIFSGLPNNSNDGDGILLYDENADRWLFSQFSLPNYPNGPFYENVAVSQTNDPTGSWYRYQFQFSDMPDYPKLAVWVDGYYMTIRRFASGSGNWLGPAAVAMERDKMLAGQPNAQMVMFNLPSSSEGTQAADCDSDFPPLGTPCPVCYLTMTASGSVRVYDFAVNWTTPSSSTFAQSASIPIAAFTTYTGNAIPQKGTSQKLDAMSGKRIMFRMPYRKFSTHSSMLINTTVNAGGTAGIRWMELRNTAGTWSLYQEGTYAPADGNYRWMGSIAMDSLGNIALGYSISSSNLFPSIRYTGRLANDPLGQMTIAEKGIINGGGSQTNTDGRWGDYSAMVADPTVPGKFWYTQEYFASTSAANWKTRIGSFTFGNVFSAVATALPNPVCLGDSTQLSVAANGGSGTYTYSWTSVPAGFTSNLQSPKVKPVEPTKYIAHTNDGATTRHDTVAVNIQTPPIVNAGEDSTVCWYVTEIPLNGSATNYKQFGWSTTGTGTFSSSTSFATKYFPSLADKIAGSVDLKLVASSNAPCSGNVTDIKHVIFDVCTGTTEPRANETGLLIQPNPAHGSASLIIRGVTRGTLTIASTDGKLMFTGTVESTGTSLTKNIDLEGYASGVYFVKLTAGGKVITQKMVVR